MDREQGASVHEVTQLDVTEHWQHCDRSREASLMGSFLCGTSQRPGGTLLAVFILSSWRRQQLFISRIDMYSG